MAKIIGCHCLDDLIWSAKAVERVYGNRVLTRWSPNANLVLHGCNTGLRGTSVQSIADVFAIRQEKCRVHGQKGWAYFSKDESVYNRTSPADKEIYLWAFSRGNNSYIGNITGGEKIPALIVEKKK